MLTFHQVLIVLLSCGNIKEGVISQISTNVTTYSFRPTFLPVMETSLSSSGCAYLFSYARLTACSLPLALTLALTSTGGRQAVNTDIRIVQRPSGSWNLGQLWQLLQICIFHVIIQLAPPIPKCQKASQCKRANTCNQRGVVFCYSHPICNSLSTTALLIRSHKS